MNRKGWIQIVESFLAISIFLGFLMVILGYVDFEGKDVSAIQENNFKILTGIEKNASLRQEVFLSEYSNSGEESFSEELKNYLENSESFGRSCLLYICDTENVCLFEDAEREVYSSEIFVFADENSYLPRKLKLFCYDE